MQRFRSQHDSGSQTLLRSAPNQIDKVHPLIRYRGSRERVVLVRSELLGLSHSLSITENINCERGSYLNVQKAIFHATLRKTTC